MGASTSKEVTSHPVSQTLLLNPIWDPLRADSGFPKTPPRKAALNLRKFFRNPSRVPKTQSVFHREHNETLFVAAMRVSNADRWSLLVESELATLQCFPANCLRAPKNRLQRLQS